MADIDVVSFPLAQANSAVGLPDLDVHCDYGGMHPYQGARQPENPNTEDYWIGRLRQSLHPTRRFLPSETGYHNAVDRPVVIDPKTGQEEGHRPTSERAVARYIGRLFFVHAAYGFRRTHVYQLLNEKLGEDPTTNQEASFGMVRQDWSNKPHFGALRDTIGLLRDGGPQDFTPGSLDVVSGDTITIHTKLLQKSNGEFWLAVWQEVSC